MSLFAELESLVSNAIDTVHGEATRIVRKKAGKVFSGTADSSRPTKDVIGIPDFNPLVVTTKDEGTYDGFQPQLGADRIHVSYDTSRFDSTAEWPVDGDEIMLLERDGQPVVRVSRVDPDGMGRINCVCSRA